MKVSLVMYVVQLNWTIEQDTVSKHNKITLYWWYTPRNWEAEAVELKV